MSIPPQSESMQKQIKSICDQILSFDVSKLYDRIKHGELAFEECSDVVENIRAAAAVLNEKRIRSLPYGRLDRLNSLLRSCYSALERLGNFSARDPDGSRNRHSFIANLSQSYDELVVEFPFLLAIEEGQVPQKEYSALNAELKILISNSQKEINDLVLALRKQSQKESLSDYCRFYETAATNARKAAMVWLIATGLLAAAMGWFLIWLVFWFNFDQDLVAKMLAEARQASPTISAQQPVSQDVHSYVWVLAVQRGAAKLALFSVAVFLLSWCGRNFKAQWHVYLVNKHRANALNSVNAYTLAVGENAREAILIHAANSIFAQVPTGFIPDQADSVPAPSILEIIRNK